MNLSLKKHKAVTFWTSLALNVVLCVALIITGLQLHNYRQAAILAAQEPEPERSIPVSQLQMYAQQYGVSIEFLQKFFPDEIVYKDAAAGGIVYSPIDPDLPKNDYDWSSLVRTNGRVSYREEGIVTSKIGVDVSKYQGDIDWEKVKADGIDYAIIRVGSRGYETGKLSLDDTFHQNMEDALAAGLEVGVYVYTQATTVEEAVEEADFVLEQIKDYTVTYPVVFDTEDPYADTARTNGLSREERTDIAIAFCDRVQEAGYRPMIYANIKWFVADLDLSRLTGYDKWFAQYFNQPFFPYEFQMWQYTSQGRVDGIKGNVDLNVSFVDYAAPAEESAD